MGVGFYSGPCTPPDDAHHYTFILTAIDLEPNELPPGLTRDEIIATRRCPAHQRLERHGGIVRQSVA
jgi:phosphatidylethanolamine-binding protein (PEBP) family uncharacterized protein